MLFAYLKSYDNRIVGREGFVLEPDEALANVPWVAVKKARTLLSVMRAQKRLSSYDTNGWTVFGALSAGLNLQIASEDAGVLAVIPVRDQAPVWGQPGVAIVRNTFEAQSLFTDWLDSSQSWLDSHPSQLNQIVQRLAAQ